MNKMATSQKLTEHSLTCTICTEVFDKPCTLVCNHTFCRKCVVNYTKTRPDAISAKSLLCPFCRKMTKVSHPDRPVEDWADDIKPIFLIQGLLDSFGPTAKDTAYCTICMQDREMTPAVVCCSDCDDALCDKCVRFHSRFPSSRHHDVIELSGEHKARGTRKVTCKEHTDENIKFLCKDCNEAVCPTCCIIYHRKCDLVVSIASELQPMKMRMEKTKMNLARKREERIATNIEMKSKLNEEIARFSETESEIKIVSINARKQIEHRERKLVNELKDMSDKYIRQMKADIKAGEMSVQMYQQQTELIDQALQSERDMDVYEMYRGCEVGDVEAVGDVDLKERGRIASVTFRQDISNDLPLGEIEVLYESVLDQKATPVLQDTIDVGLAGDTRTAGPNGVTVVVVDGTDTVVVTDPNNSSVKSFYTSNNQPGHSKLLLDGCPWGITKLTPDQVAVTVVGTNQIVTVKVKPDLELLTTMRTSAQYVGITSLTTSTLAACSWSPPCVDILDMTGNVLWSISPLHKSNNTLRCPSYLSTTKTGNILVSDHGTKCVMCLTPEGDVVFNYSPTGDTALEWPRGVTSTSTGDILVTDHSLHRVILLTESGQFVRNILTSWDITYPACLCGHGQNLLCIGCYSAGVVKVYRFGDTRWAIVSRLASTCIIL